MFQYRLSISHNDAGSSHLAFVSLFSVCYNFEDHPVYRKDGPLRGSRTLTEEKINWVTKPPAQVMFQDRAVWYEPEVSTDPVSVSSRGL